jgi:hypothetical protein
VSPRKHLTPEQKKARDAARLKVAYYIEEILVLTCTLVGIIVAEAIQKRAKGQPIGSGDLWLDWYNLLISTILALIYYGGLYTNWKDFERTKPALPKRIGTALLTGAGWKAFINF